MKKLCNSKSRKLLPGSLGNWLLEGEAGLAPGDCEISILGIAKSGTVLEIYRASCTELSVV